MRPSRVEMQVALSLQLRDVSRRRFCEEMVRKVLQDGALQPHKAGASQDVSERRYVVLIVDDYTLRMVNAICQIQDVLEQGVCLVELIGNVREALPVLDAIYFVSPTESNIRQLIEDAVGGEKKMPHYNSFHVFFTHKLSEDLLRVVASSRESVSRISSFAEANLGFVTHDARTFHFASRTVFEGLFDGDSRFSDVSHTAECLATLLASLGVLQPIIRVQRSSGQGMNAAQRLGITLQMRLSEILSKGPLFKQEHVPQGWNSLVIMDRSYDWPAVLAHDFHYEAAVYDLLGGGDGAVSIEDGVFKHIDNGAIKNYTLGDDKDPFWQLYRHMPVWEESKLIMQEVQKLKKQDSDMRNKASSATSNMARMAANAMNVLQSLPEHKERFAKLQVHLDISNKVTQILEGHQLTTVSSFEQDLLTGVDFQGKDVTVKRIEKDLESLLTNPDVPNVVKQRLVMLFSASDSVEEAGRQQRDNKIKHFARRLPKKEKDTTTSAMWLDAARVPPESNERRAKRRDFYRKEIESINNSTSKIKESKEQHLRLARWRPQLRDIMEQAATNNLSHQLFPELGSEGDIPKKVTPSAPATGLVIVFVVGGLTLTEARQAHEVSRSLGIEVFAGGDCMVTAAMVTEELNRRLHENSVTGGSVG